MVREQIFPVIVDHDHEMHKITRVKKNATCEKVDKDESLRLLPSHKYKRRFDEAENMKNFKKLKCGCR